MIKLFKRHFSLSQTRFSFGATSAIITSLGLITGLRSFVSPQLSIVGGLFIIAVADNIADSLGIHIYQEAECLKAKEVWFSTFTNFLARFLVTFTFALPVMFFTLDIAVIVSIVWGILLLSLLSYSISKRLGRNPYLAILEHIVIAVLVILISNFAGKFFSNQFSSR